MLRNELLETMFAAAVSAGKIIMDVYNRPHAQNTKADGSPVTEADDLAEAVILEGLKPLGLPVLAEESVAAGRIPELGNRYFVVDPLDGTKEFIKRNGEFTVNIALVEDGTPTHGIVLAPALGSAFTGSPEGAIEYRTISGGDVMGGGVPISVADRPRMRIVASRSHGHAALGALCADFNVDEDVSVGSSLKFCLIANGTAQLYPRFTPTCEWDTAAGQAVLLAAGGHVLTIEGTPLSYGKSTGRFYNPYFVAASNRELAARAAGRMFELVGEEGLVRS